MVTTRIDTSQAHPARMYDFYLGGKDNFQADRDAAWRVLRIAPESRKMAQANRAFLQRAVRYLVAECGIRQIIDIGTGLPTAGNVHEVAQAIAPETRTVCVDNDPIVHVMARALLTNTAGHVAHVQADARQPEAILTHPEVQHLIDFSQPVALLLIAVLHFLNDDDRPAEVLAALRDAMPTGSYLVLSHGTRDFHPPAKVQKAQKAYEAATEPFVLRTREQIRSFFAGWDIIEPGLVQVPLWHPDGPPPTPEDLDRMGIVGGVARRPG
jgi:S-adenosyl methyltransferase